MTAVSEPARTHPGAATAGVPTAGRAFGFGRAEANALPARAASPAAVPVRAAVNPAAADTTDPRGPVLKPGLSRRVLRQTADDGRRRRWMWPGVERAGEPEAEPMVSADTIEEAARRIGNVLRVDGAGR